MNVNPDRHGSRNPQNHFAHRRGIKELLHLKDDDSGYIEGKVFMVWPPRNRLHRIQLEVTEGSTLYRFEVEVPHKDGITFRPHERVSLVLKGMKVDQRKESSAPHYFPIVLRFPDGVVLKYLTGVHAGAVINTWENTDEWYQPGVVHSVSHLATAGTSEVHRDPVPEAAHRPMLPPPCTNTTSRHTESLRMDRLAPPLLPVSDDATTPQSMQLAQQSNAQRPGHLSKRARKKRRLLKEKELASSNNLVGDASKLPSIDATMPCSKQSPSAADGSSANLPCSHSTTCQISGHTNGAVSTQQEGRIDAPPPKNDTSAINIQEADAPDLELKAGFRTQRGDVFTALSDLEKGPSMINVIGIVTSVYPEKKTRTNEWSRSFALVDPSLRQGVRVNCFQKKYLEWLPQVQNDDIVILRKLKIGELNGAPAGIGYSDKLRWAVYDPLKHSTRPPNKGDAPESERIDDGMGYEFSPYWEPFQDSTELEYCRQIGEWKVKCELEGQNVSKIQCSAPSTKQHLLISEASPGRPPNGYFNCTVEVLHKFSEDRVTDVYVTDYTINDSVHPIQAAWCPPALSDYVMKCSMWDNASNVARMMNPGEYWYLYNVRAKWNPHQHMEGTLQFAEKLTQLDNKQAGTEPHLNALLERKKVFKSSISSLNSKSASLHVFPETLLQDVDGSTNFLTCIVELLHIDLNSRDGSFIYVTDYTYNPDLPTTVSTSDWACNLEHRVVKIKLDDTQAQTATGLSFGSMYIIHNLRIKRLDANCRMQGYLGGERSLIVPCDSSDDHAQTLQRNKEKWKRENTLNVLTDKSHEEAHGLPKQPSIISANATLQEVLAKPAPNVFRVLARAKDFFPFSLEDACVLRCTKCDLTPPPSFKQCPRCDDMMETHSKWFYCLYIRIEDDKGSELTVSLSGRECTLLQDLDPTDFRRDREAFRRFLGKVDPVLGNLRNVHAAWSRNEDTVIESPPMIFGLESWNIGNEKGYSLLDCNPA